MRTALGFIAALSLICAAPAAADVISDPVGDIISSYTGPPLPAPASLDVTSFSVNFDGANFLLSATMAGPIPSSGGFYVVGVDRGARTAGFTSIGHPGVLFDTVVILNQDLTSAVNLIPGGATASLGAGAVTISGSTISAIVPLSRLPSTGFSALDYGFNIWPRSSLAPAGNGAITDFAPDNSVIHATFVPEPSVWAMLIAGFGMVGFMLRRRRELVAAQG